MTLGSLGSDSLMESEYAFGRWRPLDPPEHEVDFTARVSWDDLLVATAVSHQRVGVDGEAP